MIVNTKLVKQVKERLYFKYWVTHGGQNIKKFKSLTVPRVGT